MRQFKTFLLEEDCPYNISKSLNYYLKKLNEQKPIWYRQGKNFIGRIIDVHINYIDNEKVQLFGTVQLLKNELEVDL